VPFFFHIVYRRLLGMSGRRFWEIPRAEKSMKGRNSMNDKFFALNGACRSLQVLVIFAAAIQCPIVLAEFAINDRVKVDQGPLNVRNAPAGGLIAQEAVGNFGTITGGPTPASLNGTPYNWYQVHWDDGLSGWSVDAYLVKAPTASTFYSPYNS